MTPQIIAPMTICLVRLLPIFTPILAASKR